MIALAAGAIRNDNVETSGYSNEQLLTRLQRVPAALGAGRHPIYAEDALQVERYLPHALCDDKTAARVLIQRQLNDPALINRHNRSVRHSKGICTAPGSL